MKRQPKGVRTGGQFATDARSDDVGDLDVPDQDRQQLQSMIDKLDRIESENDNLGLDQGEIDDRLAVRDELERALTADDPDQVADALENGEQATGDLFVASEPRLQVPAAPGWVDMSDPSSRIHFSDGARYARDGEVRTVGQVEVADSDTATQQVRIGQTTIEVNRIMAHAYQTGSTRIYGRRADADGSLDDGRGAVPVKSGDWVITDDFSNVYTVTDDDYHDAFNA